MGERMANAEQIESWNGPEGAFWAAEWEQFDRTLQYVHERLGAATGITDGERVLDIGCGNGQSTRQAAAATPSGHVLGVDLSGPMLERARALTADAGLANIEYVQADAQVHPFEAGAFDLAMSRFGSMFFEDRAAAFANIGRALRPGGRLLLVVWQAVSENEHFATLVGSLAAGRTMPAPPPGAPGPFSLADPEVGRSALEAAGFVDVAHEPVRGTFVLGPDADAAFSFAIRLPMVRGLAQDLDEATRTDALDTLHRALEAHETAAGVAFDSATWFITARRP